MPQVFFRRFKLFTSLPWPKTTAQLSRVVFKVKLLWVLSYFTLRNGLVYSDALALFQLLQELNCRSLHQGSMSKIFVVLWVCSQAYKKSVCVDIWPQWLLFTNPAAIFSFILSIPIALQPMLAVFRMFQEAGLRSGSLSGLYEVLYSSERFSSLHLHSWYQKYKHSKCTAFKLPSNYSNCFTRREAEQTTCYMVSNWTNRQRNHIVTKHDTDELTCPNRLQEKWCQTCCSYASTPLCTTHNHTFSFR